MRIAARLAAFCALLAGVFAVAAVLGSEIGVQVAPDDDPAPVPAVPTPAATPATAPAAVTPAPEPDDPPEERKRGRREPPSDALAVSDGRLRLSVPQPTVRMGQPTTVRFRLAGTSRRKLSAVVIRRDARFLTRPVLRREARGEWAADLRLPRAGTYRLVIDAGRRSVGTDLFAPGPFEPMPLPAPSPDTTVDGYAARLQPDGDGALRMQVARRGKLVAARPGRSLVALRSGDMAYAQARPSGGELRFRLRYPGPGRYRVFVPFSDGGREHVAAFTTVER